MESGEEQKLRDYFERGFRDLQLADIKHADAADVRMGTFQQCAAFLDALALTYSASPLKVKGGPAGKWDRFITDFFDQPEYAPLVGKYAGFRCLLLHNFSASGLAFIHGHPEAHLLNHNGKTILNRESFVADVGIAFERLYEAVRADEGLRDRALKHLDKFPPVGVWFLDATPGGGAPPVATAAMPPFGVSASFALSATTLTVTGGAVPAPVDRPRSPTFARPMSRRRKKRKR